MPDPGPVKPPGEELRAFVDLSPFPFSPLRLSAAPVGSAQHRQPPAGIGSPRGQLPAHPCPAADDGTDAATRGF